MDNATSELLYGRFVKSESTAAYLSALEGYIGEHGVPQAFYTDGHSAFFAKPAADGGVSLTAFGSALEELEIEHIRSSCPENRGRCERAHGIAQDRLVKEMANEVNIEGKDEAAAMVRRVDKNRLFKYKSRQYAVELSPAVGHWTLRRCGVEICECPTGEIRVYCNNKRLEVREVGAALTAPWQWE